MDSEHLDGRSRLLRDATGSHGRTLSDPLASICEGDVTLLGAERFARALRAASHDNEDALCEAGVFDRLFSGEGTARGRGATTLLDLPGQPERIFLRMLRRGGWLGPWLGRLGAGRERGLREIEVNAALHLRGAPVPEPAMLLAEDRRGCAVGTVYVEDSVDGLEFLEQEHPWAELRAGIEACAHAVRSFHDAGASHPDLQLKNLLIRRGYSLDAFVIDLDGVRLGEAPSPERRMSELMRLYRSLAKRGVLGRVGRDGIAVFFSAYCDSTTGNKDRELRRALWRRLPREWRKVKPHGYLYPGGPASLRLPPRRPD